MSAGSSRANAFPSDFRRYLVTRLSGTAANQMLMVALAWQMYDLTGRAFDLGMVGLLQFLPALLLTLPAGHLVDRTDRRRVLAAALVLQGVVALLLAWGTLRGWAGRETIYVACVVLGVARALQLPSQQAMVPALVAGRDLPRALAASASMLKFAVIGGPVLGGFLYAAGPAIVYALCLLLLAVSVAFLARIRSLRTARPPEEPALRSVLDGLAFIWNRKQVLGAISLDLFAVLMGGATALLPMYAKDVLSTGPWGLGILRAAPAVGALAVALALARWPIERRAGRSMLAMVAVYGVSTIVFGVSRDLALSVLALAAGGGADMVSVVIRHSLVQLDTPDEMRGRVSAVSSVFIGASNELGEFRAGTVAEWIGPVAATVVGGVGTLVVVACWMRLFPSLLRRDRLQPREDERQRG